MDELEEAIGKMCGNLKRKGITGDEPKRDPQDGEAAEAHKESASSSFIVKNALTYIEENYTFKKQEGVSANEYRNQVLGK